MNTRSPIVSTRVHEVLSVSFNSDSSCFAVALNTGICVFHSKTCLLKASRDFSAGISLVEMMGNSQYLALRGGGKQPMFPPNKAIVWDDLKGRIAITLSHATPVRGLKLSRTHIFVILLNSLSIYTFEKSPTLTSTYETADNPLGLCAISTKCCAIPGRTSGQIQVIDLTTDNVTIIPAHSSALQAIALSHDGQYLASASETGTLIRLFATSNNARIAELRRGVDPARILSIAFNTTNTLVACTSDKSTVHIFDVPSSLPTSNNHQQPRNQSSQSNQNNQQNPNRQSQSSHRSHRRSQYGSPASANEKQGKWGVLGRVPFMPRLFSDVYSFAKIPFEMGDEGPVGEVHIHNTMSVGMGRPTKGLIGWLNEETFVVVSGGRDARWEKFVMVLDHEGKRKCVREGWKRYLEVN